MTTSFNINEFIYDFKNCCNKVQKKSFNKDETIHHTLEIEINFVF